ncbi:MAG: hypothetical protein R2856_15775 [Caldilineaceae bacterium]
MKRNILFLTIALLVLVGCVAPEPAAPAGFRAQRRKPRLPRRRSDGQRRTQPA